MHLLRHALSEVRRNFFSLKWWRDTVFVPYVIGTATRLHPNYPGYGEAVNVMEEDWDNLVVLDACRADAFEEMVDLDRFDEYRRTVSHGSHSKEWTRRNFAGEQFGDTVYISANPHTTLLADDVFHELVEVWKDYDVYPNLIAPSKVAEAAVDAHRRFPDKRLIVHFMQPHGPGRELDDGRSREETYYETIPSVINVVEGMLDELGGKSVITADHGELFTSGFKRKIGINTHRAGLRFPKLVYVPWAVVDGERRKVTEDEVSHTETDQSVVESRLRDLGYHP